MEQKIGFFGRMIMKLSIFRRLNLLEEQAAHTDKMITVILGSLSLILVCPRCGALLDSTNEETKRYSAKTGKKMCCIGCRAFYPKDIARVVSGFESTIRKGLTDDLKAKTEKDHTIV